MDDPGELRLSARYDWLLRSVLIAIAVFVAAKSSQFLTTPPSNASPVWPGAGIALAVTLLYGRRVLIGVFVGVVAFEFQLFADGAAGRSLASELLLAGALGVGACAQAWAGSALIQRALGPRPRLVGDWDILRFQLLGGPLACLVAATVGVAALWLVGVIGVAGIPLGWLTWWVGDSIGVIIFAPLVLIFFNRDEPLWYRRRVTVALPMLLLLLTAFAFYAYSNAKEGDENRLAFAKQVRHLNDHLGSEFDAHLEILDSLRDLYSASVEVTRAEFEVFTRPSLVKHPGIQALEWIPRVTRDRRAAFETGQLGGRPIRRLDPSGALGDAVDLADYYPVHFATPVETNRPAVGFDVTSNPAAAEALYRARDTGNAAATGPLRLVQETEDEVGIVIYQPVYIHSARLTDRGQRREAIRGVVAAVFRMQSLLDRELPYVAGGDIALRLSDVSKPGRGTSIFQSATWPAAARDPALAERHELELGGRRWLLEYVATPGFITANTTWAVWVVLTGGLLVTAILGTGLLILTGRTVRMEDEVIERTTELRQEVDQRRDAENRLRLVLQGANLGFWDWDYQSGCYWVNDRWLAILGLPRDGLRGRKDDWADRLHPDDRDAVIARVETCIRDGTGYTLEFRMAHRDGHWVWVQDAGAVVKRDPATGAPMRLCGTLQDISDRMREQARLGESEQRFRSIFEQTQTVAVQGYNADREVIFWNAASESLFGYSAAQAHGKRMEDLLWPPALRAEAAAAFDRMLAEGRPMGASELTLQDASGAEVPVFCSQVILKNARGELEMYRLDTDLRPVREASDSLIKLQQAVEHSPSVVMITDTRGRIEYVNPKFTEVTGYSSEEALGRDTRLLASGQDDPSVYSDRQQRLLSGQEWSGELHNRRKDGEFYWAEEQIAPIHNSVGEISHFVVIQQDITQERLLNRQISYQASHDPLTGLINRVEFEHRLARAVDSAKVDRLEHALCFLDLDQFKVVNDSSGHVAGDELLRQVSALLRQQTRHSDTVARLGGDEFVVLLEDCPAEQANQRAVEIREAIEQFRFAWEAQLYSVSVSIGLVAVTAASKDVTEVLRQADTACYAAKDAGRNRVHQYQPDDAAHALRRGDLKWVGEINRAFDSGRLRLYAQPIHSVADPRQVSALELLLRLQDDSGDSHAPGSFLPAAERYNLTPRIDRWVVDSAFRWIAQHPETVSLYDHFSINLSGQSMGDEALMGHIIKCFEHRLVPASFVVFEITETAAISSLSDATTFIHALKAHGCRFSLDDFGSGLSSFAYLKNLPVDFLKIDGIFVRDIVDDPVDYAMVKAINEMGHIMNKRTVAEFVENDAILACLGTIGIDFAQGYGLGPPAALDRFAVASK